MDNAVECPTLPCENYVDETFEIIDSNKQADEQHLLKLSYVDEGSSKKSKERR